jgi:hypothetical protein
MITGTLGRSFDTGLSAFRPDETTSDEAILPARFLFGRDKLLALDLPPPADPVLNFSLSEIFNVRVKTAFQPPILSGELH